MGTWQVLRFPFTSLRSYDLVKAFLSRGFREYGYVNIVMLQQHEELSSLSMESRHVSLHV